MSVELRTLIRVQAEIAKRKDTSPKEGEDKYGKNADYADETNKKYPLDTPEHVRAAASYWGMPKNREKYSPEDQKKISAKIAAAKKRHGIGDGDKSDIKSELNAVSCSFTENVLDIAAESIVYLPKGKHTIHPTVDGRPQQITVDVDETACANLQQSLVARLGQPVKPIGQFNHKPGPASFRPKQFRWDPEKGVMCDLEWTDSGKRAIQGKDYLHFSPTFTMSTKTGKIAGLRDRGEIGSLTNDPAFVTMEEIKL